MVAPDVAGNPRVDGQGRALVMARGKDENRPLGAIRLERNNPIGEERRDPIAEIRFWVRLGADQTAHSWDAEMFPCGQHDTACGMVCLARLARCGFSFNYAVQRATDGVDPEARQSICLAIAESIQALSGTAFTRSAARFKASTTATKRLRDGLQCRGRLARKTLFAAALLLATLRARLIQLPALFLFLLLFLLGLGILDRAQPNERCRQPAGR
jgi:hypothetical protein